MSSTARLAAAAVALAAWTALVLQLVLIIANVTAAGGTAGSAILNFFSYFTILSNTIVAIVMTRTAIGPAPSARLIGAAILYIAVVGIVYSAVLRALWAPAGWQKIADMALHDIVPSLAVAFWIAVAPKGRLRVADIPFWLAFPIAYLAYCLIRGAIDGWYPYPFLNAGSLGYAVAIRNAAIVAGLFVLIAAILIAADRLLGRIGGTNKSSP